MEIKIHALQKKYGRKMILDNLSFTIGSGMFGLLGRNGAGKTTLLQILSTLRKPTSGDITLNEIPLEDIRQIRPLIGFLPQEFSMYPDMSVLEITHYLAALSEIPIEVQRQRIPDLLKKVNLWEDRGTKVRKLSGGMKQRLGIAQALIHDPQVLIADEPTAGLDPQERLSFYALLHEFSSDRIVIVSSHIVSDIESVCENVVVLESGRLLFNGTVEGLAQVAKGKVYELTVPKRMQASIQREYYVLSSQSSLENVKIRILHDGIPTVGNVITCTATVEDGYMEMLRHLDQR